VESYSPRQEGSDTQREPESSTQASSADKHATDMRAADAATRRIDSAEYLAGYPEFRAHITRIAASTRDEIATTKKDYGIVAGAADATETVIETAGKWWDWIRRARTDTMKSGHVALPPDSIWAGFDRALASADLAYEARDATSLRQRAHDVAVAYQKANETYGRYLTRQIKGGEIDLDAAETVESTTATTAGFALGGVGGAAAASGLVHAGYKAAEQHAGGERFNWKQIGFEGAKAATNTLVFALIAGPLGKKVFQPMIAKAIDKTLTSKVGTETAESVEKYIGGFLSGVGTGALMAAVETEIARIHDGKKPSEHEFVETLVDTMIRGGIQRMLFDAIKVGAKSVRSRGRDDDASDDGSVATNDTQPDDKRIADDLQ
jgi:hypothetical protein